MAALSRVGHVASDTTNTELIDRLIAEGMLPHEELTRLLTTFSAEDRDYASSKAYKIARARFGDGIYLWGLIALSNQCARDCFYCGLRNSREGLDRYRMTADEILACCRQGYDAGVRTFVLAAGDDPDVTDELAREVVWRIRRTFPNCAITLALGQRARSEYQRSFDAGADRYLLRHESADADHFALLHPRRESLATRVRCLEDLRHIGFHAGCGMMVGSPFQKPEHLARDLEFLADFSPELVDVGPFLPHHDTPLGMHPAGPIGLTLFVMSLVRIILPDVLMPVATAIGSLHRRGRELGIMAGANAAMTNLTPQELRPLYELYDNQVTVGAEGVEGLDALKQRIEAIGYRTVVDKGDFKERG